MTLKLIAYTSAACTAVLFIPSLLLPSDPYFDLLISSNKVVMAFRLALALVMVALALKPKPRFKYRDVHKVLLTFAALLGGFGLVGVCYPAVDYGLFNVFKPMDYMFSLIASSFMIITYFEYAKGRRRTPKLAFSLSLPEWNLQRAINIRLPLLNSQQAKNL